MKSIKKHIKVLLALGMVFGLSVQVVQAQIGSAERDAIEALMGYPQHTIDAPFGPAPLSRYAEVWVYQESGPVDEATRMTAITAWSGSDKVYTLRLNEEVFRHEEERYKLSAPRRLDTGRWTLMDTQHRTVLRAEIAFHLPLAELPGGATLPPGTYKWYYESEDRETTAHGLLFLLR